MQHIEYKLLAYTHDLTIIADVYVHVNLWLATTTLTRVWNAYIMHAYRAYVRAACGSVLW